MFHNKKRKKQILSSSNSLGFDPGDETASRPLTYIFQGVSGQFDLLLAELGAVKSFQRANCPESASSCVSDL